MYVPTLLTVLTVQIAGYLLLHLLCSSLTLSVFVAVSTSIVCSWAHISPSTFTTAKIS